MRVSIHFLSTRAALAFCSILGLLAFAGCSDSETQAETAAVEGTLLIGNGEEPSTLDPHLATTLAEAHVLYALFEGLVAPDPDDPNAISPGVANDWQLSPDRLVYTFDIRDEARWSNGDPITATDFVYSARRILNPDLGAAYAELFFDLAQARAYHHGEIDSFDRVGIRALSDKQLEIRLQQPTPNFLSKLKHFAWFPVHSKTLEAAGAFDSRSSAWTSPENIVSNGPFSLVTRTPGSVIEVRKSETYWDSKQTTLNGIRYFPYEDANTERRALLGGQLHVTDKIPSAFIDADAEGFDIRHDAYLSTTYLIFNMESGKVTDPGLRSALALALNKDELVTAIERSGSPAHAFTPAGLKGYEPPQADSYDPTRAAELYKRHAPKDGLDLTIVVSNNPSSRAMVEAVQAMWQENLGLTANIVNMEAKSLFSALDAGDFDISYLSWTGDYADPEAFLNLWRSGNSNNRARWSNERYDRLLSEASNASEESRSTLLAEAETILLNEHPIIPIVWKTKNFYLHPAAQNWPPSLLDMRSYKRVKLATPNP